MGPVVGVVAAAGRGARLGVEQPKALVPCCGRPLLDWSLAPLLAACERVVVALPAGFESALAGRDRVTAVAGGASRSQSVLGAIRTAPEASVYVVHDAARPLVTRELVERCTAEIERGWDGAIAAARATDTIKEVGTGRRVVRTLDRSTLWAAQTPQAFAATALRSALSAPSEALASATDDASLVEAGGGRVTVVESSSENLKVTSRADLERAEALLARGGTGSC